MIYLKAPLEKSKLYGLRAGGEILFSGKIYTARDQAHKRIADIVKSNKKLPLDLRGKIIYYCGPAPARKGQVIGSCGPTTSARMDRYTPLMLEFGVIGLIGKGRRNRGVRMAVKKHRVVYFLAPSGCGALLASKVVSRKLAAFEDLGPEAIYELEVEDFPLIVGIDSRGKSIYEDL